MMLIILIAAAVIGVPVLIVAIIAFFGLRHSRRSAKPPVGTDASAFTPGPVGMNPAPPSPLREPVAIESPLALRVDARARVDAHLDAVERVLMGAGHTREQRRGVVDDLESQILEMLAARSAAGGAGGAGVEDVEVVLAKLDAPSAYGSGEIHAPPPVAAGPAAAGPARYSRTAIGGLVCILLSVLPVMCVVPLGLFYGRAEVHRSSRLDDRTLPPTVITATRTNDVPSGAGRAATTAASSADVEGRGVEAVPPTASMLGTPIRFEGHTTSWSSFLKLVVCPGVLIGPLGLLGTVLGWVGAAQIRRSKGAIVGKGMALFDGLFYPVLVVVTVVVGLILAVMA